MLNLRTLLEHQEVFISPEKWRGSCWMKGLGLLIIELNSEVGKGIHGSLLGMPDFNKHG